MAAMLYLNSLLLVNPDPYVSLRRSYQSLISQVLHVTIPTGRVDIVVVRPPQLFRETHYIVSELYAISQELKQAQGREEIDVRVLLEGVGGFEVSEAHNRPWEVVAVGKSDSKLLPVFIAEQQSSLLAPALPIIILPNAPADHQSGSSSVAEDEESDESDVPDFGDAGLVLDSDDDTEGQQEDEGMEAEYEIVALGGTFDHLHDGHKILLTMAGFLARGSLIVGVTGPALLKNKKYREYLQPLADRCQAVLGFLAHVYPALRATTHEINDVYGQAITIEAINALVISAETRAGAKMINEERLRRGFAKLKVWQIGVANGDPENGWAGKLSSTDLRKREYERDQELKRNQAESN